MAMSKVVMPTKQSLGSPMLSLQVTIALLSGYFMFRNNLTYDLAVCSLLGWAIFSALCGTAVQVPRSVPLRLVDSAILALVVTQTPFILSVCQGLASPFQLDEEQPLMLYGYNLINSDVQYGMREIQAFIGWIVLMLFGLAFILHSLMGFVLGAWVQQGWRFVPQWHPNKLALIVVGLFVGLIYEAYLFRSAYYHDPVIELPVSYQNGTLQIESEDRNRVRGYFLTAAGQYLRVLVALPDVQPLIPAEHLDRLLVCGNRQIYFFIPSSCNYGFDLEGMDVDISSSTVAYGRRYLVISRIRTGTQHGAQDTSEHPAGG